jgi:hypothetical protein
VVQPAKVISRFITLTVSSTGFRVLQQLVEAVNRESVLGSAFLSLLAGLGGL